MQTRILIGDDTVEQGLNWANLLIKKGMFVATRPKNGRAILESLTQDHFDVAVIEAKMPEFDAVALIEELKLNTKQLPTIFVVSNYESEQTEREVMEAGAHYYMVKPFSPSILAERIENFLEGVNGKNDKNSKVSYKVHEEVPNEIEYVVTEMIHQIGIPAHIKGYHFLRTSILLAVDDSEMINCVTKMLYPTVAKKYSTTPSRVERAIRHAIEIAWDRGDVDTLNSFFGYTIDTSRGKPTNSEFIALIADKLKLRFKGTMFIK